MPEKKSESKNEQAEGPKPFVVKPELPTKPIVAPDGHVVLSQEDIDNRA